MNIKDTHIRQNLKQRISNLGSKDAVIGEEIAVFRGMAIADVVAAHNSPHCYEIKSDSDTLKRLNKQAELFGKTFPKVTLVATSKHIKNALTLLPEYWGVIEVKGSSSSMTFKNIRRISHNPEFKKENLLNIIWNSFLEDTLKAHSDLKTKNLGRSYLSQTLASKVSNAEAQKIFRNFLIQKTKVEMK